MKKKNSEKSFLPELEPPNQFCDVIKCHVINYALANIIVFKQKLKSKMIRFFGTTRSPFYQIISSHGKKTVQKKSTGLFLEEKYGSGGHTLNVFKLP